MGCEWSARRQSANRPPDQQIWSWSIRYGSNRAGRMAVTEHIPGLSAMSPEPTLAAGARVMPTRAWLLAAARLDQGRDRGIALSLHARSPWVRSVWGCMPPSGGSGAAAPGGALRAIDASAQPQSWRTCGPRRLQRQSQPALIAAQGDAAANPAPATTPGRSEQQSFLHDGRTRAFSAMGGQEGSLRRWPSAGDARSPWDIKRRKQRTRRSAVD